MKIILLKYEFVSSKEDDIWLIYYLYPVMNMILLIYVFVYSKEDDIWLIYIFVSSNEDDIAYLCICIQ